MSQHNCYHRLLTHSFSKMMRYCWLYLLIIFGELFVGLKNVRKWGEMSTIDEVWLVNRLINSSIIGNSTLDCWLVHSFFGLWNIKKKWWNMSIRVSKNPGWRPQISCFVHKLKILSLSSWRRKESTKYLHFRGWKQRVLSWRVLFLKKILKYSNH